MPLSTSGCCSGGARSRRAAGRTFSGPTTSPRGGEPTGPNPTDRGKAGTKYYVVASTDGLPLGVVPSAANVHGTWLFPYLSPTYADRTVLSTDNSIYQVFPQAIAFPTGTEDLVRIAKVAAEPRFHALKL